jgi:hypothetical protein
MKTKHKVWLLALLFFGVATLIDLIIPDPLPIVDEVVLIAITLFSGYKTITK